MVEKQQITCKSQQTTLHKSRVKTAVGPDLLAHEVLPLGWVFLAAYSPTWVPTKQLKV